MCDHSTVSPHHPRFTRRVISRNNDAILTGPLVPLCSEDIAAPQNRPLVVGRIRLGAETRRRETDFQVSVRVTIQKAIRVSVCYE